MKSTPASESGIALFMVVAAVSLLSILAIEFSYNAQVNQTLAFDGFDQLKAHYLAKTGLKLSLLRLKIYAKMKDYADSLVKSSGGGAAAQSMVPKQLLDLIWSQPLELPFPNSLPGLTPADKERIDTFNKASLFDGRVKLMIEPESSKFNLNMILRGYQAPTSPPSVTPSSTPPASPPGGAGTPSPTPNPQPSFDPQAAREQLKEYLAGILDPKMEEDPEFNDAYRDPHMLEDLVDNIAGWADFSYERRSQAGDLPMKRAPFYSVSELHMIPGMDDDLYNLFAPTLTVARTPGINVNTLQSVTLKALFPLATKDEIEKFFKDRDSTETDGTFKTEEDFFKYIQANFQGYNRGTALDDLKKKFTSNNIRFITDETEFLITVNAKVNQATRTIQAWVTLGPNKPNTTPSGVPSPAATINLSGTGPEAAAPDPGVKIHFMRIY